MKEIIEEIPDKISEDRNTIKIKIEVLYKYRNYPMFKEFKSLLEDAFESEGIKVEYQ